MTTYLRLFGEPAITREGERLEPPPGRASALLFHLACRRGWVSRERLTYLFWSELPEERARSNLRKLLSRSIRSLPYAAEIDIEPTRLRWLVASDLSDFEAASERRDAATALELYRGPLLADFHLEGSPEFATWLAEAREQQRERWRTAALTRVGELEAAQLPAQAIGLVRELLDDDPLDEEAIQAFLRCAQGQVERQQALGAFDRFRQLLAEEMGLEPLAATVTLADRARADAGASPAATRPGPGTRVALASAPASAAAALPQELTPFVARPDDLRQVMARLDDPDCRLLTLLGPGGNGKTRLALRTLMQRESRYRDGVFAIGLNQVESREGLVSAVAAAVGYQPLGGDPEGELLKHLRAREALLLLDSFEPLMAEVPWLTTLLSAAPALQLLVTSREALNLQSEWLFPVTGLAYPDEDAPAVTLDELGRYAALDLFAQTSARLGVPLKDADLPAVTCIARLVAGSPLAIELAASWVRLLSPGEIARELERDLDFLTSVERDLPERHRSLRAVFEASWRRLEPGQRQGLARLALFRGGFDRKAAARVADVSARELLALTSKSLLRRRESGRFDLHPLIRHHALEKLAPEEAATTRERHADHYLKVLTERAADLSAAAQPTAQTLSRERANLVMAWREAVAQRRGGLLGSALAAAYQLHLLDCRYRQGYRLFRDTAEAFAESDAALAGRARARAAGMAAKLGDFAAARTTLLQVLEVAEEPLERAFIHETLGLNVANWTDDLGAMEHHVAAALELYQQLGDGAGSGRMHFALGSLAWRQGAYDRSEEQLTQARQLFLTEGDQHWSAITLSALGVVAYEQGDFQHAVALHQEALGHGEVSHHRHISGVAISNLGMALAALGNHQAAQERFAEALEIFVQVGDRPWVSEVYYNMGRSHLAVGSVEDAHRAFGSSLEAALDSTSVSAILRSFVGFADQLETARPEQALALYRFVADHPQTIHTDRLQARRGLERRERDGDASEQARLRASQLELTAAAEALIAGRDLWPPGKATTPRD